MKERVLNLAELALEETVAHGGAGKILFRRVFDAAEFRGPWNFVDYAVLPPGTSIGKHRHGANEELYVILEGEGTLHLEGREHRVRSGHVVVNPPGGTHGLRNHGTGPLRILVVEIPLDPAAKGRED